MGKISQYRKVKAACSEQQILVTKTFLSFYQKNKRRRLKGIWVDIYYQHTAVPAYNSHKAFLRATNETVCTAFQAPARIQGLITRYTLTKSSPWTTALNSRKTQKPLNIFCTSSRQHIYSQLES